MLIYSFNLDLINCAAACFLSNLLRESPEYFFDKTSNESNNNQPRIVIVGTDFATYKFTILLLIYDFNLHWKGIGTSCNYSRNSFFGGDHMYKQIRGRSREVSQIGKGTKWKYFLNWFPKDWHQFTFSKCWILKN